MFDPSILWDALRDEGMLAEATPVSPTPGATFSVGFRQPGNLILGDAVQTDSIDIEYVSAQAVDLAPGHQLDLQARGWAQPVRYTVRQPPMKIDDGYFSRVALEVAP